MRKIIILIILILLAVLGYNYIYQDHRDIKTEKVDYAVSSSSISLEFSNNPSESESKYLNKTIVVSGNISEINENNLTLNEQVFCQFIECINASIKLNSEIKIKGRLIGYDDLLELVKLDQCNIIK
jgi:hypothetical protein